MKVGLLRGFQVFFDQFWAFILHFATAYAIILHGVVGLMMPSEALKSIRKILSVSQEQLARDLNVSYTTLNRWENNRAAPSPLAKMRIEEYCSKKELPQNIVDALKNS